MGAHEDENIAITKSRNKQYSLRIYRDDRNEDLELRH